MRNSFRTVNLQLPLADYRKCEFGSSQDSFNYIGRHLGFPRELPSLYKAETNPVVKGLGLSLYHAGPRLSLSTRKRPRLKRFLIRRIAPVRSSISPLVKEQYFHSRIWLARGEFLSLDAARVSVKFKLHRLLLCQHCGCITDSHYSTQDIFLVLSRFTRVYINLAGNQFLYEQQRF